MARGEFDHATDTIIVELFFNARNNLSPEERLVNFTDDMSQVLRR